MGRAPGGSTLAGAFACPHYIRYNSFCIDLMATEGSTMQAEFMSLLDVGDALGVDVQTVRRWIKAGRLKAFKPGKDYRIREADLEEFLRTREVRPKAPAQPSHEQARRLRKVRETFGPIAEGIERHCKRLELSLIHI